MKIFIALCIVFGASVFAAPLAMPIHGAQSQVPTTINFKRIFDGHDIAVRTVNDIIQDRQGFMWFGTERGLYRYDGYDLVKFGELDGMDAITHITSMHIANDANTLWVGGYDRLIEFNLRDYSYLIHKNGSANGIVLENYYITDISSTPDGDILLATGNGLAIIDHDSRQLSFYSGLSEIETSNDPLIWTVFFDDKKQLLWMGRNDGLRVMDWASKRVSRPANESGYLVSANVYKIYRDSRDELWIASSKGAYRIESDGRHVHQYLYSDDDEHSIGADLVWCVVEDALQNIWLGTDHGGINVYDRSRDRFNRFQNTPSINSTINSNTIKTIVSDHQGNLWAGNFPTGVNYFSPQQSPVKNIVHRENVANSLSHNSVLSLMEDGASKVWIGTDGGGIDVLDRNTGQISHYHKGAANSKGLTSNVILSMVKDRHGVKWFGSYREGLFRFDDTRQVFESVFPHLRQADGSSLAVWSLLAARDGRIWMGTQTHGAFAFNPTTGELINYTFNAEDPTGISANFVFSIYEDSRGNIWFGTSDGINLLRKGRVDFEHFKMIDGDTTSLADSVVFSIFEDSKNNMWFGTRGGVSRFDEETKTFKSITQNEGLASNSVRSIVEDKQGNLWVGTDQGVSRIEFPTLNIQNYRNGAGWLAGPYNTNALLKAQDGEILLGSINGLLRLHADLNKKNTQPPVIVFTDFILFTESVVPNSGDGLLSEVIANTKSITLNHKQNMFSVGFSALNYVDSAKNEYAYKLDGFDDQWREIGNKHKAVYTNIDPGNYVLRIKASNSDGVWNQEGIALQIIQLPAPWKTWWAYMLYIICAGITTWWLLRIKIKELEFERNLEAKSNANLRHLNRLKSNFFANTSHELLTPLNGIIGLSRLLEIRFKDVDDEAYYHVRMIHGSGSRLSRLVRDILDFSMLSDNELKLNIESVNLCEAIEVSVGLLLPLAKSKSIRLVNQVADEQIIVLADRDRFRHIIEHLIANAIKYSQSSEIVVRCKIVDAYAEIQVQDMGVGISKKNLSFVFQEFDQVVDSDTREHGGTGLGLALTKKLVELHGGNIRVSSTEGQGSTFSFTLKLAKGIELIDSDVRHGKSSDTAGVNSDPVETQNFEPFDMATPDLDDLALADHARRLEAVRNAQSTISDETDEKQKILIVDDDTINRIVLRGILELHQYPVVEADSGQAALDVLEENSDIALIVLDIMMPKMDGYEVCRRLREAYPMHKLPIIFLTAKTTDDAYQEGMAVGGNDLITKPTSQSILLPKISSLLRMSREA